jgi:GNAT superfamily N-acetyltransferase
MGFAGYRIQHMLAHGRFLYVDDLVTDVAVRGRGFGRILLDWLDAEALREGCAGLQLDSGTQRLEAHAFYFARGLRVTSFHFARKF